MKLTVEYHAGNPRLCRIPELKIREMPECEGGGWYIPREQAEQIVKSLALLTNFRKCASELWMHPNTRQLYTVESLATSIVEEIDALALSSQQGKSP